MKISDNNKRRLVINTFTRNPPLKLKQAKELFLPSIQNNTTNNTPSLNSKSSQRNNNNNNVDNQKKNINIFNRINSTLSILNKPIHVDPSLIFHFKKKNHCFSSNQISNENILTMNHQSTSDYQYKHKQNRIIKSKSNFLKVLNQAPLLLSNAIIAESKTNGIPLFKIKRKHYEISKAGRTIIKQIKINQDSYLMLIDIFDIFHCDIFGVLDGHGTDGHLVSSYIKNKFISDFCTKENYNTISHKTITNDIIYKYLTQNNYEMIYSFYANAERNLFANNDNKINTQNSGTTCVIVYCIGNKIICSNTGDSRAIVVSKMINGNYKYEALSIDHKPMNPDERSRIEQSGGIIAEITEEKDGPYRIFAKGELYPGIAVSRSLGDAIATEIGVISTPDIIERDITSDMCYIIVGSDGLWEYLDPNYIIKTAVMFYINNDPKGLCSILISEAHEKWSKKNASIDDITCIVYFINKYNPSKLN